MGSTSNFRGDNNETFTETITELDRQNYRDIDCPWNDFYWVRRHPLEVVIFPDRFLNNRFIQRAGILYDRKEWHISESSAAGLTRLWNDNSSSEYP
jgi:hypothetical protein